MSDSLGDRETNALQMVRAEIRLHELQRWMGSRRIDDMDRAMHAMLTECFGDLAPKPFRLIAPRSGGLAVLYGYGQAGATALQEQEAICADPLQIQAIPLEGIRSKPMPFAWRSGLRVGFDTRIRPVVRRSRGAEGLGGSEQDAFQIEAMRHPTGAMPRTREAVYIDWLSSEVERRGGARLEAEHSRMVSFQRRRSQYKPNSRPVEGPDAVMRGSLIVADSEAFVGLLSRGIGRHRAYGYGMLLLRPARR
ncbi:MAG: type I-E CRISPR-associated protein Cas6/Cse3/CasE [Chloroflexi bacterium]|nr:type I-E CRISPR-associated protein Cas6/Cse3/CasE [Chloroflexota bacterium]